MKTLTLREVAHSRSGEKGNNSTISVIAYDMQDYALLCEQVTVEAVRKLYGPITKGSIKRYEAPHIGALNFVLDEVLEGGRSRTLAFEESGKALSSLMLSLPVTVPDGYIGRAQKVRSGELSIPSAHPSKAATKGKSVRLGSASAWSRDRFEPAEELVARGNVDYLCFDSMSEITMSAAQVSRMEDQSVPPYDPYLVARMEPLLKDCKRKGIRIITNQGWLDPVAAAERIVALGRSLGIDNLKVAAVGGAILSERIRDMGLNFIEGGRPIADSGDAVVSAEAYMGAQGIVEALTAGADVVITSRVADACVYLGPLAFEFGWSLDDHHLMARGMIIGHLMECGGQVSGGYFADPGYKEVPGLVDIGNPIVEVSENGILLSKLPNSGGLMSEATCKEQLLYEVQDPANYICPDCIADLTKVSFHQVGVDEVEVTIDHAGKPRTPTLKALVGVREGYMTEEMVIFAGPSALERARMTQQLLEQRFERIKLKAEEIRFDYLGINAVHRESSPPMGQEPYEVILRIAVKAMERSEADKLRREVDPLAVNGVAGTGKWATSATGSRLRPVVGLNSCLVPREMMPVKVSMHDTGNSKTASASTATAV
ncbi:acyclic terpene utilization AtuA family protein [Ottowia thiooxydans]|uniref:acyclic terpene utilization AtuA family protein n=1 Tax=Ottowia thiooxydans TaxID=219182 RepID=UPI000419890A|nr:acyclic terpene utilization AtuA family protein [Ottowia thiooxydans]